MSVGHTRPLCPTASTSHLDVLCCKHDTALDISYDVTRYVTPTLRTFYVLLIFLFYILRDGKFNVRLYVRSSTLFVFYKYYRWRR